MKKKILIIEDDADIRGHIERIVKEVDKEATVYSVSNTPEAYKIALELAIDVFLIDIVLESDKRKKELSGIVFAERIRRLEQYSFTPMIFITGLEDPKLYAFSHIHCYAYIEKPFNEEKVRKELTTAIQFRTETDEDKSIFIKKNGVIYPVPIKEIVIIESKNHELRVYTTKEMITSSYMPCKKILMRLDSKEFIQCSRNAIINIQYIDNIDPTNKYIKMKAGIKSVEIGAIYKKSFMEKIGL